MRIVIDQLQPMYVAFEPTETTTDSSEKHICQLSFELDSLDVIKGAVFQLGSISKLLYTISFEYIYVYIYIFFFFLGGGECRESAGSFFPAVLGIYPPLWASACPCILMNM